MGSPLQPQISLAATIVPVINNQIILAWPSEYLVNLDSKNIQNCFDKKDFASIAISSYVKK